MSTPLFKSMETSGVKFAEPEGFVLPPSVYPKGTEAFVFSPQLTTLLLKLAKSESVNNEDDFIDRLFSMALPYPSTIFEINLEEPDAQKYFDDLIDFSKTSDGTKDAQVKKLCMHVTDQTVPHKHGHYMAGIGKGIEFRAINMYIEAEVDGKKLWNGGFADMFCFKNLEDVALFGKEYSESKKEIDEPWVPRHRIFYGMSDALWSFASERSGGNIDHFEEILQSFRDHSLHYKREQDMLPVFVSLVVFSADSLLNCKSGVSKKRVPVKPSVKSLLGSKKRKDNVVSIAPVNYQTVLHLTGFEHINKKGELKSRASAHAHTVRAHFKRRKTGVYLWGAHVRGKGKLKKREMYDVNT